MLTQSSRQFVFHRGIAASVSIILLVLSLLCPVMHATPCPNTQHTCHNHTCWFLLLVPLTLVIVHLTWLLWASRSTLLQEYLQLLFRPPRPLFA
jgi:hypothetical protein